MVRGPFDNGESMRRYALHVAMLGCQQTQGEELEHKLYTQHG